MANPLPDFTRLQWASTTARDVWAPRLTRIVAAWERLERLAVIEGDRPGALQVIAPEHLPDVAAEVGAAGLLALPLARQDAGATYQASASPAETGKPWAYRVAIARPEDAPAWTAAWARGADGTIGALLGYPACCRLFFRRTWGSGSVDPTAPAAAYGASGPPGANILLRWLGVRLVSHLPCSFTCQETVEQADRMVALGRRKGFGREIDWILEMLDWPVLWTAKAGLGELKTPILRAVFRTDVQTGLLRVERPGRSYPDEGAAGNGFPFQTDHREPWRDNGFTSAAAQAAAHDPILDLIARMPAPRFVLDLGAGDGGLLARIRRMTGAAVVGIELDPARVERGRRRHPDVDLRAENIFETAVNPRTFDLVLLMPGRLLEDDRAGALRERLTREPGSPALLVYAYGDWLTRFGSLAELTRAAGLRFIATVTQESAGSAAALLV